MGRTSEAGRQGSLCLSSSLLAVAAHRKSRSEAEGPRVCRWVSLATAGWRFEERGYLFWPEPLFRLVSRGQWSDEETEEEEDDDVSPMSGPTKAGKAEGDLQINVEDEEAFVLPPAGEVEQDILGVRSEGWRKAQKRVS